MELTTRIYSVTRGFPSDERFGVTAQMRRAAVSACSNIAEGYARRGATELKRFLGISLGSLAEVDSLVEVSHRLGYLSEEDTDDVIRLHALASKLTYRFLKNPGRP